VHCKCIPHISSESAGGWGHFPLEFCLTRATCAVRPKNTRFVNSMMDNISCHSGEYLCIFSRVHKTSRERHNLHHQLIFIERDDRIFLYGNRSAHKHSANAAVLKEFYKFNFLSFLFSLEVMFSTCNNDGFNCYDYSDFSILTWLVTCSTCGVQFWFAYRKIRRSISVFITLDLRALRWRHAHSQKPNLWHFSSSHSPLDVSVIRLWHQPSTINTSVWSISFFIWRAGHVF